MDEFEVLGLFEGLVAMGGLEAVGDDVAREGGQEVVGLAVASDGGHAAEGTQGAGDLDILAIGGGDLNGAQGGGAVAMQQGELSHTARYGGTLFAMGGLVVAGDGGEELAVGFEGGGVGMGIEELRVFG